jgi:hypothetical protein
MEKALNSPVDADDDKAGSPRKLAEVPETVGEKVDSHSSKEKASEVDDMVEVESSEANVTKRFRRRPKSNQNYEERRTPPTSKGKMWQILNSIGRKK